MTDQVDVVEARAEDLQEVFGLYEQAFPPTERVPVDLLRADLGRSRRCSVLRRSGQVVGFAIVLRLSPRQELLEYMAVEAASRGRGHGSALLAHVRSTCTDDLFLEVEDPAEAGLGLDERRERERRVAFYVDRGCAPVPFEITYRPPSFTASPSPRLLLFHVGALVDWSLVRAGELLGRIGSVAYAGAEGHDGRAAADVPG